MVLTNQLDRLEKKINIIGYLLFSDPTNKVEVKPRTQWMALMKEERQAKGVSDE